MMRALALLIFLSGCAAAGAGVGVVANTVSHSRMKYLEQRITDLEQDRASMIYWLDATFGNNQWRGQQ